MIKRLEKLGRWKSVANFNTGKHTPELWRKQQVLDWPYWSLQLQKWVMGSYCCLWEAAGSAPAGDGQTHALSQVQPHEPLVSTTPGTDPQLWKAGSTWELKQEVKWFHLVILTLDSWAICWEQPTNCKLICLLVLILISSALTSEEIRILSKGVQGKENGEEGEVKNPWDWLVQKKKKEAKRENVSAEQRHLGSGNCRWFASRLASFLQATVPRQQNVWKEVNSPYIRMGSRTTSWSEVATGCVSRSYTRWMPTGCLRWAARML